MRLPLDPSTRFFASSFPGVLPAAPSNDCEDSSGMDDNDDVSRTTSLVDEPTDDNDDRDSALKSSACADGQIRSGTAKRHHRLRI